MTAPVTKIRYLKRQNLENEARLQKGYYDELIQHFGVDVAYFRLGLDYYGSPSGLYANYTYGESTTSPYNLSAEMVVYLKVNDDTPILRQLGIETTMDAEIYFTKERFTEQFRDLIGTPTSANISTDLVSNISNFTGYISGDVINSDISGITSAYTTVPSGTISGAYSSDFTRYPKPLNADLKVSYNFTDRQVLGDIDGSVSGTIDASGNGTLGGTATGDLNYFVGPAVSAGPHWGIAPQVGDFFRMLEFDMDETNYFEYEVTDVLDKELTPQGLNPHLHRYVWRCTIVRRDPSLEVVEGTLQEEQNTPTYLDHNVWDEIISDEIFDYTNAVDSVDGTDSDNAYGGYGT